MDTDTQIPRPDTDFGDEKFDEAPITAGRFSNINETIFRLFTPKRKPIKQEPIDPFIRNMPRPPASIGPVTPAEAHQKTPLNNNGDLMPTRAPEIEITIPPTHEIQNGLLFPKKTLAEKVRDQIKFPVLKSTTAITNGLALAVFAVGSYLLYAALPTHPDLILGIILVSLAGNVLMNNR